MMLRAGREPGSRSPRLMGATGAPVAKPALHALVVAAPTQPQHKDDGMKRQEMLEQRQSPRSFRGTGARRAFGSAAAFLALTACATAPEPRIITRTVEVPVSVPCAVKVDEPTFPDSDEALAGAADIFEAVKLVMAGRLMRMAALGEYRAAVAGCAR